MLVKAVPYQRMALGEGANGSGAIKHVLENSRRWTGDMRKLWHGSKSSSRKPSEAMTVFFFPAPGGGEKPIIGGKLRWYQQRVSRMRVCVDRDGTVDDLGEGVFACLPPHLRHGQSRTLAYVI
jgi:hypothetical protein